MKRGWILLLSTAILLIPQVSPVFSDSPPALKKPDARIKTNIKKWIKQLKRHRGFPAQRAKWYLVKYSELSVPYVEEMLHDEKWMTRGKGLIVLGEMGETATIVLPSIIQCLNDKHEAVRSEAAKALYWFGDKSAGAVPELITALSDTSIYVRINAARTLSILGKKSAPAVPALVEAIKDKNQDLQSMAIHALANIGPPSYPAVPILIPLLKSRDKNIRKDVARTLGKIGTASKPATDALEEALQNDDYPLVRHNAAYTLSTLGKRSDKIAETLHEMWITDGRENKPIAEALSGGEWNVSSVGNKLIYRRENQEEHVTEYIGRISFWGGNDHHILADRPCVECDANKSIYLYSPKDAFKNNEYEPKRYEYPGTAKSLYEDNKIVNESRVFWGQCLPDFDPRQIVIWYQKTINDKKELSQSVQIVELTGTGLKEHIITKRMPKIRNTLKKVKYGTCREIPGENRHSEP